MVKELGWRGPVAPQPTRFARQPPGCGGKSRRSLQCRAQDMPGKWRNSRIFKLLREFSVERSFVGPEFLTARTQCASNVGHTNLLSFENSVNQHVRSCHAH